MNVRSDGFDLEQLATRLESRDAEIAESARLEAEGLVRSQDAAANIKLLHDLRKQRRFEAMKIVAELAQDDVAHSNGMLQVLHAQALIDTGQLAVAETLLGAVCGVEVANNEPEETRREARGLMGRAAKQRFVASVRRGAPDVRQLQRAVDLYHHEYVQAPDKSLWHGVNAAALLQCAARRGVAVAGPEPAALADDLVKRVKARVAGGDDCEWDHATAAEAFLVLGDRQEAERWLSRYAEKAQGELFALAGTWRQLREIWELDAAKAEDKRLLSILEDRLFERHDKLEGRHHVRPGVPVLAEGSPLERLDQAGLERVFGENGPRTFKWYLAGVRCAASVGRVVGVSTELPVGTGFLMLGRDVHSSLGDELVFLTNAHVVTDNPQEDGGKRRSDVKVLFENLGSTPVEARLGEMLRSFPMKPYRDPRSLDCSILRLEGLSDLHREQVRPLIVSDDLTPVTHTPRPRIFIIGYPMNGPVSVSLDDNRLLDFDDDLIHYTTPTEPGHSGSPVFDDEWRLVGIHHRGLEALPKLRGTGTWPANEAARIKAIRVRYRE